jgi:hypothetical protein
MSCNICCENFKTNRPKICCQYCDFEACRACCEKYILSEEIPKCMMPGCGKEWSRKFIKEKFTNSFLTSDYKEHLETILFDKEKALLPATQPLVEEKIRKQNIKKEICNINKLIEELLKQKRDLEFSLYNRTNRQEKTDESSHRFVRQCPADGCRGFLSTQWKCGLCENWTCPDCHELKGPKRDCEHTCDPNSVETAKLLSKDSKPCPKCQSLIFKIEGCFAENTPILMWDGTHKMSQDIRLGDILVGDDGEKRVVEDLVSGEDELYEVRQSVGVNYTVNSKHTLVLKDSLTSNINLIVVDDYLCLSHNVRNRLYGFKYKSDAKYDIEVIHSGRGKYYGWTVNGNNRFLLDDFTVVKNCDQMWCTQCRTAFSWKTGNLESHIHNPHYYEWMRKNNGGVVPRTHGDVPPAHPAEIRCGQELSQHISQQIMNLARKHGLSISPSDGRNIRREFDCVIYTIYEIIHNIIHNARVELPTFQTDHFERNQELRIRYLEGQINEEEFKILIQRADKKNRKNIEISQIITLCNTAVTDIIHRFYDYLKNYKPNMVNKPNFEPFIQEIKQIRNYCNNILREIAFTYNCVEYIFVEYFHFEKVINIKCVNEKSSKKESVHKESVHKESVHKESVHKESVHKEAVEVEEKNVILPKKASKSKNILLVIDDDDDENIVLSKKT